MKMLESFVFLTMVVKAILGSELSWEEKYDLIFNQGISHAVQATGVSYVWSMHPTDSMEQRVASYAQALDQKADEVVETLQTV